MSARVLWTWLGLLLVLAVTVTLVHFFPAWSWLSLAGAALQVALILGGFMRLQEHPALVRFFALGACFWILLMFTLTLIDLLTRD